MFPYKKTSSYFLVVIFLDPDISRQHEEGQDTDVKTFMLNYTESFHLVGSRALEMFTAYLY